MRQTNSKTKIKDFIALPRKIRDDYFEGKLTKNELDVLIWIWLNTNPVNGYFAVDYRALTRDFQQRISYDNIRKIISSLRKKQYIYFLNHKGRKGSFPIYPLDFLLSSGQIQTFDYLKRKHSFHNSSTTQEQLPPKLKNNLEDPYHNLQKRKKRLTKLFSMDSQISKITTAYNNTDTNTKNNYY